jgi:hypothetical protein
MGLRDYMSKDKNIIPVKNPLLASKNNLEKHEIAAILNLIKTATFQGDQLEMIYSLVVKLQNQYNKLEENV